MRSSSSKQLKGGNAAPQPPFASEKKGGGGSGHSVANANRVMEMSGMKNNALKMGSNKLSTNSPGRASSSSSKSYIDEGSLPPPPSYGKNKGKSNQTIQQQKLSSPTPSKPSRYDLDESDEDLKQDTGYSSKNNNNTYNSSFSGGNRPSHDVGFRNRFESETNQKSQKSQKKQPLQKKKEFDENDYAYDDLVGSRGAATRNSAINADGDDDDDEDEDDEDDGDNDDIDSEDGDGGHKKNGLIPGDDDGNNASHRVKMDKNARAWKNFWKQLETLSRFFRVILGFPFVIIVSSLNISNTANQILRSSILIRTMNSLMYVIPYILVKFVLVESVPSIVKKIVIIGYIGMYLSPVVYVVIQKMLASRSQSKIEEGTFCFKPACKVHVTQANFWALVGFFFEWIQHVLYVLPAGVVASKTAKLSDYPPFLQFEIYFWIAVSSSLACGLILIINAVAKGKLQYYFQRSYVVWFFVFNVGSPMYVTIVTILFMGLNCDYNLPIPSLVQDSNILCYSPKHIQMQEVGLIAIAIYLVQHTLLPSGTFKETMRDNDLEIMFVPVYLQGSFFLKSIFCYIYVFFNEDNWVRCIGLTLINILLLIFNYVMKPCSVGWVNVLRDTIYIHACISGIQALNFINPGSYETNTLRLVIFTLGSNILFTGIVMYFYFKSFNHSTEYSIALAFLDLEWQVSRGGAVNSRVLEPLISLTLSPEEEDRKIAKKYIDQLIWLISYPNMRVQFQAAWGLANLALIDEDARLIIHKAGGTRTLLEWYPEMEFIVQLEALAALTNLTNSFEVSKEMVYRYKCIPFFMDLIASNKLKHSQFATIAIGNLARVEDYRKMLRMSGGIQILVGCITSEDYQKRKYALRALANIALSLSHDLTQVFKTKRLISRIVKLAKRNEIETQKEVIALIRNLSCHSDLRVALMENKVVNAIKGSRNSIYPEVCEWVKEIEGIMLVEVKNQEWKKDESDDDNQDKDFVVKLENFTPLIGGVEWSTWGSKLDSVFSPVFFTLPSLSALQVKTVEDTPVSIKLSAGASKEVLAKWKNNFNFQVLHRPEHGTLNEYITTKDSVIYTPDEGFSGSDHFTFRLNFGSLFTGFATVAIIVREKTDRQSASFRDVEIGSAKLDFGSKKR